MKKLLLFVTMAAALLFTQCKKDDKNSMPSAGKTVRMTVTAGPGSKTDIADDGAIKWSAGDKLYVGDGSKYIGCLTLVGEGGSATGVFSGNVTLGEDVTGKKSFGFFYLGSNPPEVASNATSVDVKFDSQTGLLGDLGSCHVGYGSAMGTVVGNVVTDINVMMVSKVAIAHFSFKKDAAYTGALTLKGDNICNKMTVNFNSAEFACEGTKGGISLTNETTPEKYVMLVPTSGTTTSQTLTFVGEDVEGTATLEKGILPNQFYRGENDKPIAVTLKDAAGKFSVAKGNYVEFAPGNLYWDGSVFKFESNQWGFASQWSLTHVSHFRWGNANDAVVIGTSISTSDGLFCASNFTVTGDSHADWRTLTRDEWNYLLSINPNQQDRGGVQQEGYGRKNALNLSKFSEVTFGESTPTVKGLIIMPDGYDYNTTPLTDEKGTTSYSRWQTLEAAGAVFLPAAGYIDPYARQVKQPGVIGRYWSSTLEDSFSADRLGFGSDGVIELTDFVNYGGTVRLVR